MVKYFVERRYADLLLRANADAAGCSAAELLNAANIPHHDWHGLPKTPQLLLPKLWRATERLAGKKHVGLHIARHIQLADLGSLGMEMLSAENPLQALEDFGRHAETLTTGLRFSLRQQHPLLIATAEPFAADTPITHHALDAAVAASATILQGQLSNGLLRIHQAHFVHDGFGHRDEYTAVVGCPCLFNQRHTALVFQLETLPARMPAANPDLHNNLRRQLDEQASSLQPWKLAIRQLILQRLEQQLAVNRRIIAAEFGMSERSLLRRLAAEGQTFQELSNACHEQLAIGYLQQGWTAAKIAETLGFADAASLGKMLKRRTGKGIRALQSQAR